MKHHSEVAPEATADDITNTPNYQWDRRGEKQVKIGTTTRLT